MAKSENEVINLLKDYKNKIRKMINVGNIILIGSRARGDYERESDVDIIIISKDFEGTKSFKRSPDLYKEWDWRSDYDLDIICLTPEEYKKKKEISRLIRKSVDEGIEI